MKISDPVRIAFQNIMAAKIRSFLTILGIIIGVGSVILIAAIGRSAQALIIDQIQGIGSNLVAVLPGASNEEGPPASVLGIETTTLKYDDLLEIKKEKNVPGIVEAAGYIRGVTSFSYKNDSNVFSFVGVTSGYPEVEDATVEEGRFFTEAEEKDFSRVAVLGSKVKDEFFPGKNPVGEKIKIKEQYFEIIGILEERGSSGFGVSSQDDAVFVPLKTAQKVIMGVNHLGYIRIKVEDASLVSKVKENVAKTLRKQHDIDDPKNDDFSVRDQSTALDAISQVTDILRYFLLAIGSMALIAGGIGIMNIMLISVTQRIREVGLRKAVGAKGKDIFTQFIIESSTISFLGGILGIILGVLFAYLIFLVAALLSYDWKFIVSWQSIVVASSISILIGIIFGLYPAGKAAKISPMEALRYE